MISIRQLFILVIILVLFYADWIPLFRQFNKRTRNFLENIKQDKKLK